MPDEKKEEIGDDDEDVDRGIALTSKRTIA